jgi:hypothetical protein
MGIGGCAGGATEEGQEMLRYWLYLLISRQERDMSSLKEPWNALRCVAAVPAVIG